MAQNIRVALGTADPRLLDLAKEAIARCRELTKASVRVDIESAPLHALASGSLEQIVLSAKRQAEAVLVQKQADVGCGTSAGHLSFLYRKRARKASFGVLAIVSVHKNGLASVALPSSVPDETIEEFYMYSRSVVEALPGPQEGTPVHVASLADLIVQIWEQATYDFPEPTIDLMH